MTTFLINFFVGLSLSLSPLSSFFPLFYWLCNSFLFVILLSFLTPCPDIQSVCCVKREEWEEKIEKRLMFFYQIMSVLWKYTNCLLLEHRGLWKAINLYLSKTIAGIIFAVPILIVNWVVDVADGPTPNSDNCLIDFSSPFPFSFRLIYRYISMFYIYVYIVYICIKNFRVNGI